jgi:hypothetical protein
MRAGMPPFIVAIIVLCFTSTFQAWAFEEGELVKKEAKWQYKSNEDPGLK